MPRCLPMFLFSRNNLASFSMNYVYGFGYPERCPFPAFILSADDARYTIINRLVQHTFVTWFLLFLGTSWKIIHWNRLGPIRPKWILPFRCGRPSIHPSICRNIEQNYLLRVKVCEVIGHCTWLGRYDCVCRVHTNMNRTFFVWAVDTQLIHTPLNGSGRIVLSKCFLFRGKSKKFVIIFRYRMLMETLQLPNRKSIHEKLVSEKLSVLWWLIQWNSAKDVSVHRNEKSSGDENDLT